MKINFPFSFLLIYVLTFFFLKSKPIPSSSRLIFHFFLPFSSIFFPNLQNCLSFWISHCFLFSFIIPDPSSLRFLRFPATQWRSAVVRGKLRPYLLTLKLFLPFKSFFSLPFFLGSLF